MSELAKNFTFVAITLLTGGILFFISRKVKPGLAADEKEKEQLTYFNKWGLISLLMAVVISPFYFIPSTNKTMVWLIVIVVYVIGLLVNGHLLKYQMAKTEAKHAALKKAKEQAIDEEEAEQKEEQIDKK